MNSEWIIVKNTKHKKNPQLAIAEKIVVLDGSEDALEALIDELRVMGKVAYKLSTYEKYFNTDRLYREYDQKYKNGKFGKNAKRTRKEQKT